MTGSKTNGHFQRILIGYDGSQPSQRALEMGLTIASIRDSNVEVLAVVQPPEPSTSVELHAVIDEGRQHYERALRKIADAAKGNGIHVETSIVVGHPAEQIIQRAEQSHADLIVVGRRGISKFENLILGSVSERVLTYAPCPVLVTR
ncbi:MAG TPA: universal stress protein [Terriglobales bacterium]|nr:universal stress protein [Terriglobales bacterium]